MHSFNRRNRVTTLFILSAMLLFFASDLRLFAQQYPPPPPGSYPPPSAPPYPPGRSAGPPPSAADEPMGPGTSVGGKWMQYSAEDPMTAQKRVRFELLADDTSAADVRAKIILFCSDGDLKLSDFRPNTRIAGPDRPSLWGRPQMVVRVRANDRPSTHSWNWVYGNYLSMDKGTTRELIGANLFRIEFNTPRGPEIAEFSPAGLDLSRVKAVCGLTPKKP